MSIIKFVQGARRTLPEMYQYLTDENKTSLDYCFGVNTDICNAVEEMQYVKNLHHMNDLVYPYKQIIIDYNVSPDEADLPLILEVSKEIAKLLVPDYRQALGVIHYKNIDHVHCHYMINTVSLSGVAYHQANHINWFRYGVNDILNENGLEPLTNNKNWNRSDLSSGYAIKKGIE